MRKIIGLIVVFGLVGALAVRLGFYKAKDEFAARDVKPGKVDVVDFGEGVKLEMVLIPAGKFMMGFTKKELVEIKLEKQARVRLYEGDRLKEALDWVDVDIINQGRQHEVTLTKAFYMGKYEVTQEQWEAVMGNNPSERWYVLRGNNPSERTKDGKLPVTDVSWDDCQNFIKKLNSKTSGGYRLPTEAEWEYACRAGTTTAYSFGDKVGPNDLSDKLQAVGSHKANAFGLYDMHNNASEWCEDWFGEYPFAVTDPKGPATGKYRVHRGGSSGLVHDLAYSSCRGQQEPNVISLVPGGLRLAKTK
jgi:formylglycine-generating enzyme required for sulfatase activity